MTADERQKQRRERFIAAGIKVFGRKGVSGATVRELCAEAGFTDRYYYALFSDLDNLFAATYEAVTAELVKDLYAAMHLSDKPIAQLAQDGLQSFYRFLQADPDRARILLVEAQIYYYSGKLHFAITDEPYLAILGPVLSRRYPGIDSSGIDVIYTIKTLLGMVISSAAIWCLEGMKMPIDEAVNNQLFVWHGLDVWLRGVAERARHSHLSDGKDPLDAGLVPTGANQRKN